MDIIKLVCIDRQHAEIARLQMSAMERTVIVLGRAVIATGGYNDAIAKVKVNAMAYSDEVTEYDLDCLKHRGEIYA